MGPLPDKSDFNIPATELADCLVCHFSLVWLGKEPKVDRTKSTDAMANHETKNCTTVRR